MDPFDLVLDQTLQSYFDLNKVLEHTETIFAHTEYQLEEIFIDFLEKNYGVLFSNCWIRDETKTEYQLERILNYETPQTLPYPKIPSWRGNKDLRLDFSIPQLSTNFRNWEDHEQLLPFAALDCEHQANFNLLCLDYSYKTPAIVIWHTTESFGLSTIKTTKVSNSFKEFLSTPYTI